MAACIGLLALAAVARSQDPLAGTADPPPTKVTSDSAEFCHQLAGQLEAEEGQLKAVPPDVVSLTEEGRRMCEHGQVRPGIFRLRRALQIIQGEH